MHELRSSARRLRALARDVGVELLDEKHLASSSSLRALGLADPEHRRDDRRMVGFSRTIPRTSATSAICRVSGAACWPRKSRSSAPSLVARCTWCKFRGLASCRPRRAHRQQREDFAGNRIAVCCSATSERRRSPRRSGGRVLQTITRSPRRRRMRPADTFADRHSARAAPARTREEDVASASRYSASSAYPPFGKSWT